MRLVSLVTLIFIFSAQLSYCAGSIPTDELVQFMNGKSATTCRFVAELVLERGTEAIPALIEMSRSGDAIARANAIIVLRKLKDPRAIPALIVLLSLEPVSYASRALREFGKDAVEPLLNALRKKNGNARRLAVRALGNIDDQRAVRALQKIFSNRNDLNWKEAALGLAKREDEIGYSVLRLADEDEQVREAVSGALWHREDKRLLPIFFKFGNLRGIAKNAGRAELPRIFAEGLDKTWVLPFVEINAAIEGIEPERTKADILWRFVVTPPYTIPVGDGIEKLENFYSPEDTNPIRYAIEKLASLGDAVLPIIENAMKGDNAEVRRRAFLTLVKIPPSEKSTDLLLKALDAGEVYMLGEVARALGDRKEQRAVPKLISLLRQELDAFWEIVKALDKIGDKTALPAMIKVWKNPGSLLSETGDGTVSADLEEWWRPGAAGYIAEVINHWKIADASLIPLLTEATLSSYHGDTSFGPLCYHKIDAFRTFVRIGKPSVETLKQLMKSKDILVRELAETALKVLDEL